MWMDRVIGGVAARMLAARVQMPSVGLLAEARMHAAERVLGRHRAEALALARQMDARVPGAAEAYGALAEIALAEMRTETRTVAHRLGIAYGLAAEAHARFGDTDATEHIDDPDFDEARRVRLLAHLDTLNTALGSYRSFLRALAPLVDGPTRVLDLAAGHGGFALEAARLARANGPPIHFTATDLKPEYLALGEAVARREGLDVAFQVADALDLSTFAPGEYDVVMCTQSLHHFSASMNARIFREAARIAKVGVVLIDPCRSVLNAALVPTLGLLRFGDLAFAHDGFVSLRRAYSPEELGLLARLGPEADGVVAKWMRPAHCLVRWRR